MPNSTFTTQSEEELQRTQPVEAPEDIDSDQFIIDAADQVSAQQIAEQQEMQASQVEDVGEAQGVTLSEDPAIRQQQLAQAKRLEQQATGQAPSIAEQQFNQNLDRIMKAQHAQAATARGGQGSLLAQREATLAGQDMMQEAGRESAMLRMQEQQMAEQQLAGVLESVRNLDVTVVMEQARIDHQTQLANLNTRLETAVQNARLKQEATATSYTTEFERNIANQNAQLQADLSNQAANLQVAIQNAQNRLDTAKTNFQAALQAELASKDIQSRESQLIFSEQQASERLGTQLDHTEKMNLLGFAHDLEMQGRQFSQQDKVLLQQLQHDLNMQDRQLTHDERALLWRLSHEKDLQERGFGHDEAMFERRSAHELEAQSREHAARAALQTQELINRVFINNENLQLEYSRMNQMDEHQRMDFLFRLGEGMRAQAELDLKAMLHDDGMGIKREELKLMAEAAKRGEVKKVDQWLGRLGTSVEILGGIAKVGSFLSNMFGEKKDE